MPRLETTVENGDSGETKKLPKVSTPLCRRKGERLLTFRAREYNRGLNKCHKCGGYDLNCGDYKKGSLPTDRED